MLVGFSVHAPVSPVCWVVLQYSGMTFLPKDVCFAKLHGICPSIELIIKVNSASNIFFIVIQTIPGTQ